MAHLPSKPFGKYDLFMVLRNMAPQKLQRVLHVSYCISIVALLSLREAYGSCFFDLWSVSKYLFFPTIIFKNYLHFSKPHENWITKKRVEDFYF